MGEIFNILINRPFGLLMNFFYGITENYAFTLLFFTVVVQIILLPIGIKQQKSQIRMAKIKPKEQVIRKKYAGRSDTATQQKMQQEVMAMYKQENYSPMSGCLPMLIQLPIIFSLFRIVRSPLTYIAGFSAELIKTIETFLELPSGDTEINIIKAFESADVGLEQVKNTLDLSGIDAAQAELFLGYENMNFGFFGQSLLTAPQEALFSPLILILIFNFAAVLLHTMMTRKIQAKTAAADMANNKSMKILMYTSPVMILYFTFIMNSALGLYWIYRSVAGILQTLALTKIFPIPAVSEEDIKLAEQQYGAIRKKKKKKKKPVITEEITDEADEAEETDETYETEEEQETAEENENEKRNGDNGQND